MSIHANKDLPIMRNRYVGCTIERHRQIGVHAPINARGGELWRNSKYGTPNHPDSVQGLDMVRDAWAIRDQREKRIPIRFFLTRWFRNRCAHLLSVAEWDA